MRRIIVTLLLAYYSMGTLLVPMGDLTYVRDLPQMYRHCAAEDPDMDLCDFVVEHLMNIHDDDEHEPNEKPHQPVFSHSPMQVFVVMASKIVVGKGITPVYYIPKSYPAEQK